MMNDYEAIEFESQYQDDMDVLAELEKEEITPKSRSPAANDANGDNDVRTVLDGIVRLTEVSQKPTKKREFTEKAVEFSPPELPLTKRQRMDSGRGTFASCSAPIRTDKVEDYLSNSKPEAPKILRRIPKGDYVSLTSSCRGKRVYLRLRSESSETSNVTGTVTVGISNLLQTSFNDLCLQIERDREAKLLKEIEMVSTETATSSVGDDGSSMHQCSTEKEEMSSILSCDLWVERFKPSNYLELLSDDGMNRSLLRWLKLWDKVVFGKEVKILRDNEKKGSDKLSSSQSRFKTKKNASEVNKELDQWGRPSQKVALLCGPPGLGKTTVAHIMAKHAGYNVVEMNASDDRSPEAFRNQIEAATQMQSVMGPNRRPNCLIIDEIDGAPLTAINVLVSIISAKPRESSNVTNTTRKKGYKDHGFLLRPIVCICNDQYVPALRPLRSLALLLNFPQTLLSRLSARLLEISQREQLRVDMSTLLALCQKAENDIRSCLHTLHFAHDHGKELHMSDVHSLSVGRKDVHRSLFSVWQGVFQLPKSNKRFSRDGDQLQRKDSTSFSERFVSVMRLAQSYGEYEKIHQGLFENYIIAKYKDHRMNKASYGIDWLCFSDLINQEIHHTQNYSLMAYLPFTSVAFHLLFACNSYFKLAFPTSHFDVIMKLTKMTNVVESMVSELPPTIRSYVNSSILILDLIPLLLDVICPNLRQVNTQLYSSQEKAQLDRLIDGMVLYGLVYKQELGSDGKYTYILDHPIDYVANFPGCPPRRELTYATKQMISREIELEKLRKQDKQSKESAVVGEEQRLRLQSSSVPNHLKKLQPKGIKETSKPMKDFFGRIIESKRPSVVKHSDRSLDQEVWFCFKEGYSNAVRRNVSIKDLL